jgi:hypothetical protein
MLVQIFLTLLLVTGCIHYTPVTRETVSESKGFKSEAQPSTKGFRIRALVLPVVDESETVPESVLQEVYAEWIIDLEKNTDLIILNQSNLKLTGNSTQEISASASKSGIPIVLEPKIVEISATRKVDPVGIIRTAQSELVIRTQLRVVSTRSVSEAYNKIKSVTVHDSQVRIGDSATSGQFVVRNPNLAKQRILESFQDFLPDIQMLLSKFAWEGRVALVQGDRIYLNVGRLTGLKIGDILKVSDIGEEIYDPQSGQFIGRTPGRVKGTVEIISYFGEDGSVSIVHSGSGFRENDRVELHW